MIPARLLAVEVRSVMRKRELNQARCFKRSWAYPFPILSSLLTGLKWSPEKNHHSWYFFFLRSGQTLRPTSISSLASAPLISCSGHHVVTAAEPCNSSSASCSIPTDPRSTYEAGRCLALSILFCIWTPSWIHLFCRPFQIYHQGRLLLSRSH